MSESNQREQFELANRVDELCDHFEAAWAAGGQPRIEDYLINADGADAIALFRDLLAAELGLLPREGQLEDEASYCQRFPDFTHVVHDVFHSIVDGAPRGEVRELSKLACRQNANSAADLNHVVGPGRQFGSYELISLLGEGGMGQVWKARHLKLGKIVALKVLSPSLTAREDVLVRFEREMKAVGRLEHPHIVRAYDAGEVDGTYYLVLEYIEGLDLAQYVSRKGPRPLLEACEMIRQAALGLHHAHGHGLVHRDVKPSNLFFARSGLIKVLDLGLARLLDETVDESSVVERLTAVGQIMGTPDYMAPEQCQSSHAVDLRADLYSLGCTLFCVLVGRPPLGDGKHNSPVSKLLAHLNEPIPDLKAARPDVPDDLLDVYGRLMQKRPEDRYQSGEEVAEALKGVRQRLKTSSGGSSATSSTDNANQQYSPTPVARQSKHFEADSRRDSEMMDPANDDAGAQNDAVTPKATVARIETQGFAAGSTLQYGMPTEDLMSAAETVPDSVPSIQIASATSLVTATTDRRGQSPEWIYPGLLGVAVLLFVISVIPGMLNRGETESVVGSRSLADARTAAKASVRVTAEFPDEPERESSKMSAGSEVSSPIVTTMFATGGSDSRELPLDPSTVRSEEGRAELTSAPTTTKPLVSPNEPVPEMKSKLTVRGESEATEEPSAKKTPASMPDVIPTVGPKTIVVGQDEGMVATLAEALRQANGNDTIEIATDEPLLITEPLVWNQPGKLEIRAAEGHRPILMAAHDLNDWLIGFRNKASVLTPDDTSIVLSGLTLLDNRAYEDMHGRTFIVSHRPITIQNVICISRTTRFLVVSQEVEVASLENCYVWRRSENVPVPNTLCDFECRKVHLKQNLLAGSSSVLFGANRNEIVAEHNSFIGTIGAWQVSDQSMTLKADRNLYVGNEWVANFHNLSAASVQARFAAARARLPRYRGEFNSYFQCRRLVPSLSDQPETDLAVWQVFTNNGEVSPQFVDPGFLRPDLLSLVTVKALPPLAFSLKSSSRIGRLGIGCDVSVLPTFPKRLTDLLGAELRFDGEL